MIVISRNGEIVITEENAASGTAQSAVWRDLVDQRGRQSQGRQTLVTWDPHTRPIITEYA